MAMVYAIVYFADIANITTDVLIMYPPPIMYAGPTTLS